MAVPDRQHPDDTHGVYDPNSEYANTKPDLRKLEGGNQTSDPGRGHSRSVGDKDSKDEVGEDKHSSKEGGGSKSESPESLKDSEENSSLFNSQGDDAGAGGDDFNFRHEKPKKTANIKGKAKGLLKKKWLLALGGVGAGGLIVAFIILVFILGEFAIPNFIQNITAYQFARVTREVVASNAEITSEKLAIDSSSDSAFSKLTSQYKGLKDGAWGKINQYRPEKVVENLKADGRLSFEYGPPSKILGRQKIERISLVDNSGNTKTVEVPENTTTALDKVLHPIQYTKDLYSSGKVLDETLSDSLNTTFRGTNYVIRGLVGKNIRELTGVRLYRWSKQDNQKINGETDAEADVDNARISYNETTNSGASAEVAGKDAKDKVKTASDDAEQATEECVKSDTCLAADIKSGQGLPAEAQAAIDKDITTGLFDSLVGFIAPAYTVAVPVCMVYQGSIVNSGGIVDANSAEDQRTFYSVASAADQQKDGTNVNGTAVGALQRQLQPINQSNSEIRASGVPVNTTDGNPGPEASGGGTYSKDVLNLILPGPLASAFSQVASPVCAILTNPWLGLGAGVALLAIPGADGAEISLDAAKPVIMRQIGSLITGRLKDVAAKLFTKKEIVKLGVIGGATAGAAFLMKYLVMQSMGGVNSGLDRGTAYDNQADAGGNVAANEIDQRGNYGTPMTSAQVALSRMDDQAYLAKQNASKSAYQRYLALDNPSSLLDKVGMSISTHISLASFSSMLSSVTKVFNPMFVFSKVFGSMSVGKTTVAAAATSDTNDYNIVQWGWTTAEENAYENNSSYSMLNNQQILDKSGKEKEIVTKYGKCFTDSIGTLLSGSDNNQDPEIVRDDNGNVISNQGLCAPDNLGMNNPDYGNLVFRYRVAQRNLTAVNQLLDTQQATPAQT